MKQKLSVVLAGLLVLFLSGNVFAHGRGGGYGTGIGQGDRYMGAQRGMSFGSGMGLFRYLGLDDQMRKTALSIRKERLAEQEKALNLVNEMRDLNLEIRALSLKAESDPAAKKTLIAKIKRANEVHKKLWNIRENSRKNIQNIRESERKEAQKKVDLWVNQLDKKPAEFQKYLDFLKSYPASGYGSGYGYGSGRRPMRGRQN